MNKITREWIEDCKIMVEIRFSTKYSSGYILVNKRYFELYEKKIRRKLKDCISIEIKEETI